MKPNSHADDWLCFDRQHIWHPYAAMPSAEPRYLVTGAQGVRLELADGRQLIDGTSSWWSALLGYRHPELLEAAHSQLDRLPHVMFGGLTHEPAVQLARRLLQLAPAGLEHVFFCDSGSVSVEVAMKMAVQWSLARGTPGRRRFLALRGGYHGDTWGAMSLSDPEQGMHQLFAGAVAEQVFAPLPRSRPGAALDASEVQAFEQLLAARQSELCAVVLEPIVQNAGGMRFYSAAYLAEIRRLCDRYDVLLIADEIATGFGRTGKLFACEHAGITPDIMCVGKALTGGTLTLAATLTRAKVAAAIASGTPGALMHGPTFMANPLACAVALRVLEVLERFDWQGRVAAIEAQLQRELEPCRSAASVRDVRVFGAIGVVEMKENIDLASVVPRLVERGVWLRPFGKLLYTMPPFIISPEDLGQVTAAMRSVVS
ncbi:MAG TPA: adenosylmethionine--8-amino-7-oxononanoate transaminase [Polyangiaceae bacterium]|nr:adenosylmethionine--8-amino-7-oxononanoate transaminase [Polyangiaceae bacterium]